MLPGLARHEQPSMIDINKIKNYIPLTSRSMLSFKRARPETFQGIVRAEKVHCLYTSTFTRC